MKCFVMDCKNSWRKGKQKENITFHKFPKSTYKEWLKSVGVYAEIDWPKTKKICSNHFSDDCFIRTGLNIRLKPGSVPTLCLPMIEESTGSESTIMLSKNKYMSNSDNSPAAVRESVKRKPESNLDSSSSTSVISKRIEVVQEFHNYSCSLSNLKRLYANNMASLKTVQSKYHNTKRTIKRLRNEVQSLYTEINVLKNRQLISTMPSKHFYCFESSSSSTSSSIIRKRTKVVKEIHNNSCSLSDLDCRYANNKASLKTVQSRYHNAKRIVKRLRTEVQWLHSEINDLKRNQLISTMASECLE